MIRVVLAVVLATALLGVSLPAIDDARIDHSETVVRSELQRVERAATGLLESDDPADDGARRIVTLDLPAESWSDAGVESVTIGQSRNGSGGRLTWTVEGGTRSVHRAPSVPLRTRGKPVTLTAAGQHRLVLSLGGNRSRPVVSVRTFTSEEGATPHHATVASDRNRRTGG